MVRTLMTLGFGLLIGVLLVPSPARADFQKVTIDLSNLATTGDVPFDEPFLLTGNASEHVQKIVMTYQQVDCAFKKKAAPPPPNQPALPRCSAVAADDDVKKIGDPSAPQTWVRRTADGNAFQFVLGPLDASACYRLTFTQELAPASDTERATLQKQLATQLRDVIPTKFVTKKDFENIHDALQDRIDAFVGEKFHACIDRDLLGKILKSGALFTAFGTSQQHEETEKNLRTKRDAALEELCLNTCGQLSANDWTAIRRQLSLLIADSSALTPGSAKAWEGPVNSARDGHPTTTVAQIAAIVAGGPVATTNLRNVIEGRAKITGSGVDVAPPDVTSIDLLADFFEIVGRPEFARKEKDRNGKEIVAPIIDNGQRALLTPVDQLRQLATAMRDKTAADAAFADPKFPDILANQVLDQTFSVVTTPTLITTEKNPYVSMDLGIGYSSRLSKTFLYTGVNFYSTPVNKNAPLTRFDGRTRFRKSFSVLVGLTNAAFEDTNAGIKNFTSAGSLLIGAGYRFNQFVKLNAGGVAYKQQNPNPIINRTRNKYSGFVSLSIDIDVKKFIGGVGSLF